MLSDFPGGAEPNFVVPGGMFQEADQADGARRPADQTVVKTDAHEPRRIRALLVQQIETIDHVAREIFGRPEAVMVVAVVVSLVGVRDDEVRSAGDGDAIG
jgi:hypothetical protein